MNQEEFVVRFEGLTAAEAAEKASLLLEAVRDAEPSVQADLNKTDHHTQDMGATVILLLSAPAIVAISKGIAKFIARERPGRLIIETKDGKVLFSGDSSDAGKIAAAFARGKRPS